MDGVIEAEKLLQLALMLPCAAVIGWLIGAWADKHFHQNWIAIVGIIFGAISGLVYLIRMALATERATRNVKDPGDGSSDETPDSRK